MSNVIIYGRGRFPKQPAKGLCRGCHEPVPKGRRTWCSYECCERYEPRFVRRACKDRDKEVCVECGTDTRRLVARFEKAARYHQGVNNYKYVINGIYMREAFERACAIFHKHRPKRVEAAKKRVEAMKLAGWPMDSARDWWEMDHIIPFSEGGATVIENVRTLCVVCHKKRTKKWHKDRNQPKGQP